MKTHADMTAYWKKDRTFRKEYDALGEEFALFDVLLQARDNAGLTQADVAARMGTKTPAVARLEAGGGRQKHSPSLATLRKYAAAVGCRVEITLVPLSPSPQRERAKPNRHKRPAQSGCYPPRSPARNAQPKQGMPPTRKKPRAADA